MLRSVGGVQSMEYSPHFSVSPETHMASILQWANVASDTAHHSFLPNQQCCEFQSQDQQQHLDPESVPRRDLQRHDRLVLHHQQAKNDLQNDLLEDCRGLKRSMGAREGQSTPEAGPLKKPRLENQQQQSPGAPFKMQVRKEKLGERITALQQLVSPFGKTDTASVLFEAIGYIKFLQDQVQVLSTPYMKPTVAASNLHHDDLSQMGWSKMKSDNTRQDLRSRGLCLVPVSCTLQVANDNGADFWTPAIGGSCR